MTAASPASDSPAFTHFMRREIAAQPQAVQTCLDHYLGPATATPLVQLGVPPDFWANVEQVHILACGTSRHAGLVAQFWLEQVMGLPTRIRAASEFVQAPLPPTPHTLTLAISQSGETRDVLEAVELERSRRQSLPPPQQPRILGLTNQTPSTLATLADHTLPTLAGQEVGVAATKTFTTQLTVLACLLLDRLAAQTPNSPQLHELVAGLRALPAQIETVLQLDAQLHTLAQQLSAYNDCVVLGQGISRAIALEGALKLKETTYLHAEGYAAGDFLHGPIAMLDTAIPTIAIAPQDASFPKMQTIAQQAQAYNIPLIGLTTGPATTAPPSLWQHQIALPAVHPWLSPWLTVIPLQLLAYHIAIARGINVDRPRHLQKVLAE